MTTIMGWALKRSAFARLQQINTGFIPPPPGTEALAAVGVQVQAILPADTDRVVVYGTPIRSTRRESSGDSAVIVIVETVTLEIRVRVYQPGEQDEDVGDVEATLDQVCNAVAKALLDYEPIVDATRGALTLSDVVQSPSSLTPYPEPSILGLAAVVFTADLVTN